MSGPKDNRAFLDALRRALVEAGPETPEEADAILLEAGLEPADIGRRMQSLSEQLLAQTRLSWQAAARHRLEEMRRRVADVRVPKNLTREGLLLRLEEAAQHRSLSVQAVFRKRKREDSSIEELRELVEEVEKARLLADERESEDAE